MSDLKPCPFCGSEPYLDRGGYLYNKLTDEGATKFWVACCGTGQVLDSEEDAIRSWNTRAISDRQTKWLEDRLKDYQNRYGDIL